MNSYRQSTNAHRHLTIAQLQRKISDTTQTRTYTTTSRKRIAVSMYWQHKTNKQLDGPKSPIQVIVIV
jgi:hypothetical protein